MVAALRTFGCTRRRGSSASLTSVSATAARLASAANHLGSCFGRIPLVDKVELRFDFIGRRCGWQHPAGREARCLRARAIPTGRHPRSLLREAASPTDPPGRLLARPARLTPRPAASVVGGWHRLGASASAGLRVSFQPDHFLECVEAFSSDSASLVLRHACTTRQHDYVRDQKPMGASSA